MSPPTPSTPGAARVELEVNGTVVDVRASLSTTLLTVLRDDLHLNAAKRGCNQGVCGACTVEIDGVPMRACLSLAHGCVDQPVRTLEGMLETGSPCRERFSPSLQSGCRYRRDQGQQRDRKPALANDCSRTANRHVQLPPLLGPKL